MLFLSVCSKMSDSTQNLLRGTLLLRSKRQGWIDKEQAEAGAVLKLKHWKVPSMPSTSVASSRQFYPQAEADTLCTKDGSQNEWGWSKAKLGANAILVPWSAGG